MNLSSRKHKMRYLRICISFKSVLLFILTLLLSSYLFNVFAHQRLLSINDDHTCFVRPNLFRCVTKAEWMYENHTYQCTVFWWCSIWALFIQLKNNGSIYAVFARVFVLQFIEPSGQDVAIKKMTYTCLPKRWHY